MSVTTKPKSATNAGSAPAVEVARVGPPPKLRRSPLLVVASVAAICLGALLAVWAYTSVTMTNDVVAVRSSVPRGAVIQRADLVTVRIGVDPALHPIPAAQVDRVVGQRAAADLSAGGLVTEEAIIPTVVPGRALSLVGVALPPSLLPGEPLQTGDTVRVVATPGQQGEVTRTKLRTITATVVSVHPDVDNGISVVSVLVPTDQAAELAARSATGRVALVLDSRER